MNILIMLFFACYFHPIRSSCLFLSALLVYVKIIPGDWFRTYRVGVQSFEEFLCLHHQGINYKSTRRMNFSGNESC